MTNTVIIGKPRPGGVTVIKDETPSGTAVVAGPGTGAAAGQYQPPIVLPITPGQTIWTVPTGITSNKIQVFWSGVLQKNGIDWTLSGTTFTWIGPALQTYHTLEIISL